MQNCVRPHTYNESLFAIVTLPTLDSDMNMGLGKAAIPITFCSHTSEEHGTTQDRK